MRRVLSWVVAPLVLGALAYFALRGPEIRLFEWADAIGLAHAIGAIRSVAAPVRAHVPAFVAGSLPDGAWAFAFGAALALVWKKASAWMWIGAAVTASLEISQAFHLIEGVFDWMDLLAMIASYFSAWQICKGGISSPPRRAAPTPAPS